MGTSSGDCFPVIFLSTQPAHQSVDQLRALSQRFFHLQKTPMFNGQIHVFNGFGMFRSKFSHLNQSADQRGKVSVATSVLLVKVTRAIPGLPWMQAGLRQCFWWSLSVYLKTKTIFRRQDFFESEAIDSVLLRLTVLRIGEHSPTLHNMTVYMTIFEVDSRIAPWCVHISSLSTNCRRRGSGKRQSGSQQWLGL